MHSTRATKLNFQNTLPATLPGFESIKRYHDRSNNHIIARILPGEYYVSTSDEMITTVLGSCISACIRDKRSGIGGINHFMLPGSSSGNQQYNDVATRYGGFAMEHLINEIFKHGGKRQNLEIKLFGGGNIISTLTDIGKRNIAFVRDYLRYETLPISTEDMGGAFSRKINYFPKTGRVMVKKMSTAATKYVEREKAYQHSIDEKPVISDIDLF